MAFTYDPRSAPDLHDLDSITSDCPPSESIECRSTIPAWQTSFDNSTWKTTKDLPDLFLVDWSSNETLVLEWEEEVEERNYWTLVLLLFPLLTIFGNLLVCLSVYREPNLRTVTNYFIVSLAVADIMVAILVMPLAVYVEVKNGVWDLGDRVCDAWVAFDVLCCTASILNLTAISVDRCIAVTQPLKYAKHKASKQRVVVTLALTWFVSFAISLPIVLGINYTDRRRLETPWLCAFYNPDFIIYSSMGSFYIPCIVMIALYYRIFRSIKRRTRRSAALYRHVVTTVKTISGSTPAAGTLHCSSRSVPPVETGTARPSGMTVASRNAGTVDCSDGSVPLTNDGTVYCSGRTIPLLKSGTVRISDNNVPFLTTGTVHCSVDPVPLVTSVSRCSAEIRKLDVSRGRIAMDDIMENGREDEGTMEENQQIGHGEMELACVRHQSPGSPGNRDMSHEKDVGSQGQDVNPKISHVAQGNRFPGSLPVNCPHFRSAILEEPIRQREGINQICASTSFDNDSVKRGEEPEAVWSRLNNPAAGQDQSPSGLRESTPTVDELTRGNDDYKGGKAIRRTLRRRKKKNEASQSGRNSSRRERKVTKTLAVVLGVFLICWFPFFTTNIINAVCLRLESSSSSSTSSSDLFSASTSSSMPSVDDCGVAPLLFSFFVWLGYINSFLNPVIYTILNADFRKAFKKILTHPSCCRP